MIVGQSEDTATKAPVQKAKRQKKDNSQHVNKCIHYDISLPLGFKWILPDPMLETVESSVSLFEKFFAEDIMKFICEESIRYAVVEGNHSVTIDTNTFRRGYCVSKRLVKLTSFKSFPLHLVWISRYISVLICACCVINFNTLWLGVHQC